MTESALRLSEFERATMARVAWRLLPFLLLLYIISWLDRVNVGFAKLQMNPDLGLSDTAYGFGAGIFFLAYAAMRDPEQPAAGALRRAALDRPHHDHLGPHLRRHDVRAGRDAASTSCGLLLGAAEAGFLPGIVYYLSQWFPRPQRAKAVSWFMIGIPLSIVFGGPLSGWLFGLDGHLGLHGWQWMFLVEGLPAVLLGFVVLVYLTETPADARGSTRAARLAQPQRIEAEHAAAQARTSRRRERGTAAPDGVAARRHHVLLPDWQLWAHALGADHRQGSVGFHQFRGRLDLGAAVHRGGGRHGADRPQLRSHRRALHARRHSLRDRRDRLRRHRDCSSRRSPR